MSTSESRVAGSGAVLLPATRDSVGGGGAAGRAAGRSWRHLGLGRYRRLPRAPAHRERRAGGENRQPDRSDDPPFHAFPPPKRLSLPHASVPTGMPSSPAVCPSLG